MRRIHPCPECGSRRGKHFCEDCGHNADEYRDQLREEREEEEHED